jgi:tetratricopeptide (TPR) repeat protein
MPYQFEPIAEENLFQDFCRDLFNHIYNTQSFELYKTKGASQNGVDIVSSSLQIVIQAKKKKLTRTDAVLEKELLSDLAESISFTNSLNIKFKKFHLLTTAKKYGKVQDEAIKLSQSSSFEIIFWAWEDIEGYISQYPELRKKYYPHLWHEDALPKILTYVPYIDQSEIVGRKNDMDVITTLLESSNKVVLVNGIGGIGKSTLAKLYLHEHLNEFTHVVWLDEQHTDTESAELKSSFLETFSNEESLLSNLQLSFRPETPLEEKFKIITNRLQNIQGNNLLVIDNCTLDITNYDFRLPSPPNWKILLTSRTKIENYALLELEVLNDADAISLFYLHYTHDFDDKITAIIRRIGNHTLTIELLAKIANKRKLKIEELIVALNKEGLKLSVNAKVISGHQKIKTPVYLFDYLLTLFSIAQLNENSISLLRWFSILPAQNILYNDLKVIFCIGEDDNAFFEELSDITNSGWLGSNGSSFQMHQVVAEVLRDKLAPNYDNCENIIKGLLKLIGFKSGENFLMKLRYLPIIESVISHLQSTSNDFIMLLNNLAAMHDSNGNSVAAIKYYENILHVKGTEVNDDNNHVFINLAVSHLRIGDFQKALEYNEANIGFLERQPTTANTII